MTYELAWAKSKIPVWVALSETGGVHAEAAVALRAEVEARQPGRVEWAVARWDELLQKQTHPPKWVIAVGIAAQRGMQNMFMGYPPPPLLVTLVPRETFEYLAEPAKVQAGTLSAVFLSQPPARQMALIHFALPTHLRVGVLTGRESQKLLPALEQAARVEGIRLTAAPAAGDALFPALQSVLPEVDALLALPDPSVFNSQTATSILTAAYRRKIPLVGFSPAYIKAGALLALYSTPEQVGRQTGALLAAALFDQRLPLPAFPREFVVEVNPDVARSLGLRLDAARLAAGLQQQEDTPP